eukprot:357660-Chlamydomonas_euryale.AAC.2
MPASACHSVKGQAPQQLQSTVVPLLPLPRGLEGGGEVCCAGAVGGRGDGLGHSGHVAAIAMPGFARCRMQMCQK